MATQVFKTVKSPIRHWYLPLILGIVFIGVGIWVFLTPMASYITLSLIFGFVFLFAGIIEIIHAVANRQELDSWGWSLMGGIIDLILGILLVSQPQISMIVLPLYVGFGILFRSIMAISRSLELKKYNVRDWGSLLVVGILGVIFAFIMIWNPLFGGFTIVIYTALAFVAIGVFQIYLSFRLKKLHDLAT